MLKFLAAALIALATTGTVAHAQPASFQRMTYADLLVPSDAPARLKDVWNDVIADNNRYFRQVIKDPRFATSDAPAQFLYATFPDGANTILVSVIRIARLCDNGANSSGSSHLHSICPVRVTMIGPDVNKSTRTKGCFLDISGRRLPGGPSPESNMTLASFNAATGAIALRALRDGQPVKECEATIKLR